MHSIFESWDEGSLNLCTHPACFQGTSESEKLWKSWLCLNDRWICEGGKVALLRRWSELHVCRFYLVQSLVSACTDSCHINFHLLYSKSSEYFVTMTCVHSFLLSFLCCCLQIKQALKSDIRYATVASLSACQMQKLQSFRGIVCWVCCVGVCSPSSDAFMYLNMKHRQKVIENIFIRGWMQCKL